MSPMETIKKKQVIVKSFSPCNGPIGFDKSRLSYNNSIKYLLKPNELEGRRCHIIDMYWFPQIYHIKKTITQENQPVFYKLLDELKISFICDRHIN
ncbi:hypothetical protein Glove_375g64 [Diversispora epigaea]|uniref:Uncharacterized protein n=1 Tax=Diversispora epigaea TaxID=1348612 RepID=A0A397H8A9_9GLOM|nr:hypothetical protein Glove_375g64 [Diversispora epigaea]